MTSKVLGAGPDVEARRHLDAEHRRHLQLAGETRLSDDERQQHREEAARIERKLLGVTAVRLL